MSLFWIETDLDYSRMGKEAERLRGEETVFLQVLRKQGALRRIWRRINDRGHYMLWALEDSLQVDRTLEAMPTYHYAQRFDVVALNPHRLFGQFAQPRASSGRARGQLYHVRLEIDRARLGPERPAELVEHAERNARRHIDDGHVVGIWRRPHGSGAYMMWDCPDNATLFQELATLPLKGYFSEVSAVPVVPDPQFEDLAGWTRGAIE